MTNTPLHPHVDYAQRAAEHARLAAESVFHHFGHRILGVPRTLIGAVQVPDARSRGEQYKHWHYWWQAHFLECMVDAGERELQAGNRALAADWRLRARALLRGINIRNLGSYVNDYYDDMAWLTLSAGRLNAFSSAMKGGVSDAVAVDAGNALLAQLRTGLAPHGGVSWSKTNPGFVNTPATAPTALAMFRSGDAATARSLVEWLNSTLWDAQRSLYIDGVNVSEGKVLDMVGVPELILDFETNIYSYNQGTALAALLAIAERDPSAVDMVRHAEQLIAGIVTHLSEEFTFSDGHAGRVLIASGSGDGGLFTGILARYLAVAAGSTVLSQEARLLAASMVHGTARALWEGRREFDPQLPMNELGIDPNEIRGQAVAVFSPVFTEQAHTALAPGVPVELSSQLQAWMILEASALLARSQ